MPIHTEIGAERRMYLPMMALTIAAVLAVVRIAERASERKSPRHASGPLARPVRLALVCAFVLVCGALASATVARNREYASALTMWETVVDRWPHGRARYNLA